MIIVFNAVSRAGRGGRLWPVTCRRDEAVITHCQLQECDAAQDFAGRLCNSPN